MGHGQYLGRVLIEGTNLWSLKIKELKASLIFCARYVDKIFYTILSDYQEGYSLVLRVTC